MKYQDFVIKNGVFIGKFDEMYQKIDDPWLQTKIKDSYSRNNTILNIKRYKINSVVEFGCGLGIYTNLINIHTDTNITGCDISETAIKKAQDNYPKIHFEHEDIKNLKKYSYYDSILFSEITWYILDDIDDIIKSLLKHFKNKYLLHNLVFYKGQQKYGNNYFTTPKEFIDFVPFKLINCTVSNTINCDTMETSMIFKI